MPEAKTALTTNSKVSGIRLKAGGQCPPYGILTKVSGIRLKAGGQCPPYGIKAQLQAQLRTKLNNSYEFIL